jgi:osmotically-inducible protein OsmY
MNRRTAALIILIALVAGSLCAQSTDAQIKDVIQKRVQEIPVTIAVEKGVVTLTGAVPTYAQKRAALDMARRTSGVKDVTDSIKVAPPEPRTDKQIIEAVRDALKTNLGKDSADKINVAVTDRVVTLTGTLPSSYPKQVAAFLAGLTAGVVDVRNNITVKPTIQRTDPQIAMDIRSRFLRNALIKGQDLDLTVKDGVVTLTGTVGTFRQVEQAEAIVRFTPGVVDVLNQLFVKS